VTAPKALGPANFAALSAPTPRLGAALATLAAVGPGLQRAADRSPKQWQKYFFIAIAGEILFIPLIFLMAGYWDPRKAKRAEQEHEVLVAAELAARHSGARPGPRVNRRPPPPLTGGGGRCGMHQPGHGSVDRGREARLPGGGLNQEGASEATAAERRQPATPSSPVRSARMAR